MKRVRLTQKTGPDGGLGTEMGRQAFLPMFKKDKAPVPGSPALVDRKELRERERVQKQREDHKNKPTVNVKDHFEQFMGRLDSISEPKFRGVMNTLNEVNLQKQLKSYYDRNLKGKLDLVSLGGLLKEISRIIKDQFAHYESELEGVSGKAFQENLRLALPPVLAKTLIKG